MDISSVFKAILIDDDRTAKNLLRLEPGDRLAGRVVRLESGGDVWIDFGNFRARAQIQLPVFPDQVLQLKVVSTGEPLHLQVIWPSDASRQFAPVQMHHAGVLNQADQQRFLQLIDRLQAEMNPVSGSSELSQAYAQENQTAGQATPLNLLQQALVRIKSIFEPLSLDQSNSQIADGLRASIEERDCFFEKNLADSIQFLPEETQTDKFRTLPSRHIKPQLTLLKTELGRITERWPIETDWSAKDLRFFKKSVDRLLDHFEQQQERVVQRHNDGNPVQVVTHWLSLKEQVRPLKLKIYYPKKGSNQGDQHFNRIALLLHMDRLGMVRADLALFGRGLRIDFYVENQSVRQEIDDQGHTIHEALATGFDPLQIVTHVNEQKIIRFDQEDLETQSAGRIDIQV